MSRFQVDCELFSCCSLMQQFESHFDTNTWIEVISNYTARYRLHIPLYLIVHSAVSDHCSGTDWSKIFYADTSAEQSFVLLDYPLSTARSSVNGAFMPALVLAIDSAAGCAIWSVKAEIRSVLNGNHDQIQTETAFRWAGICSSVIKMHSAEPDGHRCDAQRPHGGAYRPVRKSLFHGVLDMSLHRIWCDGKAARLVNTAFAMARQPIICYSCQEPFAA